MAYHIVEALALIAREKNIDLDTVISKVEESLLAAAKKRYPDAENLSFKLNRQSGEITMIAVKKVVDKVANNLTEISLTDAKDMDEDAELDDDMEVFLEVDEEFGRNAIATAKQVLIQKVREAERDKIYDEYITRVGQLVSGTVQQIDKGNLIINLGKAEAILPIKEQIPREKYRQGDRIRAFILDVQKSVAGPQVILSRVTNDLLRCLFELEVPEIFERVIEIRAIAREPGERSKVAVYSADERIDPVGACVGIKGVRVQSIVRELNNERIDIIPFSANPEVFVTRALAPAKVVQIDTFDNEQAMTVAVEDDKLSLAIGKAGQNARLASKLTGWKINIMSETDYNEMKKREAEEMVPVGNLEGIGTKIQEKLVDADINTVQQLAKANIVQLTRIEGIGQKTAENLIDGAKAFMKDIEAKRAEAKKQANEARKAEAEQEAADAKAAEQVDSEDKDEDTDQDGDTVIEEIKDN
ncbi:MAG: transcription termination/antitermination protein NusA [candidate division Zixibacteria bacterium HGW-Zixibacteria-1]|nr:MAG: transcription termination/antitermination protein NusA [candidate division Zixibacteria bacterium HGW-Zixibacteria-1]